MLIVTAYAYRMERIEQLLQMVDQPGEPKKFHFRQLRYTMAKTLADKVKAMAEQMLESVSVTVAESEPTLNVARNAGRVGRGLPDAAGPAPGRADRPSGPQQQAVCGSSWRRRPSRACTSMPTSGPTGSS